MYFLKPPILFLFLLLKTTIFCKHFAMGYNTFNGRYRVKFSPFKELEEPIWQIHLSMNYSYLTTSSYFHNSRFYFLCKGQFQILSDNINGELVEATLCSTPLMLGDKTQIMNNFSYYLSTAFMFSEINYENTFGLAPNINETFSLTHLLYNQGNISTKAFSFVSKNRTGIMYFGETPKEEIEGKHLLQCKNQYNDGWGCQLSGIGFRTYYYQNNATSYFNVNEYYILVPVDFLYFMGHTILGEYFQDDICKLRHNFEYTYFECEKQMIINNEMEIIINFDNGNILTLNLQNLFECKLLKSCESLFRYNYIQRKGFVFGSAFISQYVMEFNYESNSISLYSNQIVYKTSKIMNRYVIGNGAINEKIKKYIFGICVLLGLQTILLFECHVKRLIQK